MITQITDKEIAQAAEIEQLHQEVTALSVTTENLETELERERIRLAACGVVAMADTPDSAIEARKMHPDYESASCDDVKRRVDECMALRAERDALKEDLAEARLVVEQRNAMISRGVDDFVQTLTDPENQPSQWGTVTLSMYREVEAERDALKALNLKLAIGVVALAYEADALFNVDEARELMNPFESQVDSIFAGEPSFEDQVRSILKEAAHAI